MRQALVIGISTFGSDGWRGLAFAPDRTAAMAAMLTRFGYLPATPPDTALTGATLAEGIWSAARSLGPDGVLVVHLLTHGFVSSTGGLYAVGVDGSHHESTEIGHWLRQITDIPGAPLTLFLLDLCNSGAAARLSWQMSVAGGGNRAWVIAACGPDRAAFNGRFSEAVVNVLGDFAERRIEIDPALRHIPLTTVAREVRREVRRLAEERDALPQEVTGSVVDISAEPDELPFFPNPGYQEAGARARPGVDRALAPFLEDLDEAVDPWHFAERAGGQGPFGRGHLQQGAFQGRRREVLLLAGWLDGRDDVRVRVVTGSPGVGKSALLGVLVCAAHPVLREPTRPIWDHIDRPPDANPALAALHARQRSLDDLRQSLVRQLSLPGEHADPVAAIAARREPPVIVIDALDEAVDPQAVMSGLLMPLAEGVRADGRPICRLLVAMRPWKDFEPLREIAAEAGGLVDLDLVPADQLRYDLEYYVSHLLRRAQPYDSPEYSGARQAFASAVAETLTRDDGNRRAWGEFLVAGLYTHHLVVGHPPISANEDALRLGRQVPLTLPELLELDLAGQSGNRWLRPVLAAVAHAKGDGMPVRLIGQVARALAAASGDTPALDDGAPTISGSPLTKDDVAALVDIVEKNGTLAHFEKTLKKFYESKSADYSGPGGETSPEDIPELARAFRSALHSHARGSSRPADGSRSTADLEIVEALDKARFYLHRATDVDGTTLYRLFHQGLADHLRARPSQREGAGAADLGVLFEALAGPRCRWDLAEPYLLRHAGQHAADAGRLEALTGDPEYLVHADPAALAPLLDGHPWLSADDLRRVTGLAGSAVPRRRRLLAVFAVRRGAADAALRLSDPPGGPPSLWRPIWSVGGDVTAVAAAPGADLIAIGDRTGCLRIHRRSGELLAEQRGGGGVPILELAYGYHDGRLYLASVERRNVLRLWDGRTGAPLSAVRLERRRGRHLGLVSMGGRLVASLDLDGWRGLLIDMASGRTILTDEFGDRPSAYVDGRPVTVSVDAAGGLTVTDSADDPGQAVGGAGSRRAALCFHADDRLIALVGGGDELAVWDVAERRVVDMVSLPTAARGVAATGGGDLVVLADGQAVFLGYRERTAVVAPGPATGERAGSGTVERPVVEKADGADATVRLDVDLEDVVSGIEAPVTYDTAVLCQHRPAGEHAACPACGGSGRVTASRTVMVTVPAGVRSGSQIRMAGRGGAGLGGGTSGDLIVEVHERPHELFVRRGDDLHCRVDLSMTAGALGTWRTLRTLDGDEVVQVSPGVRTGTTHRIPGRGLPRRRGSGRGDLIVELCVRTPRNPTDQEQRLLRQISEHRKESAALVGSSSGGSGTDVHVRVAVPMVLAALGTQIQITTVPGQPHVLIPAGVQDGDELLFDRRGRSLRGGQGRGDIHVEVEVAVPQSPDAATRDLLRKLEMLRQEETPPAGGLLARRPGLGNGNQT
ncbi:DnaJ C-terminal domain-containing protein [Actinoplanes subglobosus]|uniref:DnaJ C-terminal domain-containing protein n=1 Tax=Actinoplanes subglobosus TaxID=1547892 RepID=A0ABV8IRB9_9ACTN